MYQILGNAIKLTKGDSFQCKVNIFKDREQTLPYIPEEGDVIRFALRRSYECGEKPLIIKEIPNDTLTLELTPQDTSWLFMGEYLFDIELTKEDGRVDTFIKGRLFLEGEVE